MFVHVSVILFTGGGGLCPSMHHRSHDQGVSVQGGSLSSGGFLSKGGGGSLSKGSVFFLLLNINTFTRNNPQQCAEGRYFITSLMYQQKCLSATKFSP